MVFCFESCKLIICMPTVYKTIGTLYTNRGIHGSGEGNYTVKCVRKLSPITLKSGKANGPNLISNEMLKNSQKHMVPCLRKLFNLSLLNGIYSKILADGYITPIFKNDDPNNPSNYRGIIITSAIGKLFNNILNLRLDKYLNKHKLIHPSQIGFTKNARTSDRVFILRTLIDKYCNTKGGCLYTGFIDFHKAFDSVVHVG